MVIGEGITKQRAGEIVNETTGGDLRPLEAEDLGLQLPSRDFSFDSIAAPAGLATLVLVDCQTADCRLPICRTRHRIFLSIGNRQSAIETILFEANVTPLYYESCCILRFPCLFPEI